MRSLILLRHAKTETWYEGVDDHARALTERGRRDTANVAEAMREAGWTVDLAIVSTARRARETWLGLAPRFGETRLVYSDELYLAPPDAIAELLAAQDEPGSVLLVGHNPGLHDFALGLLRAAGTLDAYAADRLQDAFPTACAARFDAEEDTPFRTTAFKLTGLIRAKDLRGKD